VSKVGLGSVGRLGHKRPSEPRVGDGTRLFCKVLGLSKTTSASRREPRKFDRLRTEQMTWGCRRPMIGYRGRRGGFFRELTSRLLHLYWNFASHLVKTLHQIDVSAIYSGYPFNTPPTRVTSLRQTRALAADRCRWSSIRPRSTA